MGEAKKGYSIWSLLVIMTLLAVWMAVPKYRETRNFDIANQLFFVSHQLSLWSLIGALCWLLSGKRKLVFRTIAVVIVVVWSPITLGLVESMCTGRVGNTLSERLTSQVGLMEVYRYIYKNTYNRLGYGRPD